MTIDIYIYICIKFALLFNRVTSSAIKIYVCLLVCGIVVERSVETLAIRYGSSAPSYVMRVLLERWWWWWLVVWPDTSEIRGAASFPPIRGLVGSIGVLRPLQLDLEPLHADLEAVHRLDRGLGASRIIERYETYEKERSY